MRLESFLSTLMVLFVSYGTTDLWPLEGGEQEVQQVELLISGEPDASGIANLFPTRRISDIAGERKTIIKTVEN